MTDKPLIDLCFVLLETARNARAVNRETFHRLHLGMLTFRVEGHRS
jgi:hypothetical protein